MKINNPYGIKPSEISRKKRADGTSATDFASFLDGEGAEATSGASASTPMAPLDAMLSLQQVSDDDINRSKGTKYAYDLLDSLASLKSDILNGEISPARLHDIEQRLKQQRSFVADPRLAQILDEIEIRAAVEIAKGHLY